MSVRKTYIINIDGTRADYIDASDQNGYLMKTIKALNKDGYRFNNCTSELPSNTGTNHTSILTATHPGTHGILGVGGCYKGLDFNHSKNSKKYGTIITDKYTHDHLQTPTFFNIIKKNNKDLITAFIPGKTWLGIILSDEDCDITIFPTNTPGNCGYHNPNPSYVTPVEGYVLGGLPGLEDNELPPRLYTPGETDSVDAPAGTLDLSLMKMTANTLPSDTWIMDQTIETVKQHDPDFMYIILMNIDFAGHTYGAVLPDDTTQSNLSVLRNPDAMRDQLRITDLEIKRFIDFLNETDRYHESRVIITSDHGMTTTKSMISRESWKQFTHPFQHSKKHRVLWNQRRIKDIDSHPEELYIDIREILKENGVFMRASLDRWNHRYNENGQYDWCFSDGGVVGLIFGAKKPIQEKIKKILLEYKITENKEEIKPIWMVLTTDEMDHTINPFTGRKFRLKQGNFNDKYDAEWPDIIVFPQPHYMIPMYNDQLSAGLMPIMIQVQLPYFIDLRTSMGLHGTYLEQDVPLVFISESENKLIQYDKGTSIEEPVYLIDVIPTINQLNEWESIDTFEGHSLFEKSDKKINSIKQAFR